MFERTVKMYTFKFVLAICGSFVILVDALTCPLSKTPDQADDDGSTTGATYRLYECIQSGSVTTCGVLIKEIEVPKGVLTNLNYNTSEGYSITTQYHDHDICYTWRHATRGCQSECNGQTVTKLSYTTSPSNDKVVKIDVKPKFSGKFRSCPISKRGDVIADKVAVDAFDCTNHPEGTETCTAVRKSIILNKDKLVNLDHDVNDYAVMLKFHGEELCASYRRVKLNETNYNCRSGCENMFDVKEKGELIAPYEEYVKNDGSQDEVKYKYIKFLNVTNFNETDSVSSAGYMVHQSHPFLLSAILVLLIGIIMKS